MDEWKQFQIDHFNRMAENYDSSKRGIYTNSISEALRGLIKGKDVLYIGCGTGTLIKNLSPKALHGIDISPGMIGQAIRNNPEHSFEVADAEEYTPKRRYEVIMIIECIDHMQNWKQVIRNMMPYTGTLIVSTTPKKWYPILRVMETLKLKMREGMNRWVPPSELEEFLGKCEKIKTEMEFAVIFVKRMNRSV